ncbi:MAG: FHA domain-containing protein, partial [Actinophytocola sp.]|uniref:FHA domain-containing protein n=1 Tax=Actinophytocola sp. TaxID=1872138 RepID=UPI003D6B4092
PPPAAAAVPAPTGTPTATPTGTPAAAPAAPSGVATSGAPEPPAAWRATVSADRAYFDSVMAADGPDAGGIKFPPYCPDRHFPLQGKQVSIGRQSRSRGIDPDIDLTGPPEDPGVSHLHALLLAQDDGSWSVVDLDSANGTTLNDEPDPMRPNTPRPLTEGDRVYLGAWTRITLRRA